MATLTTHARAALGPLFLVLSVSVSLGGSLACNRPVGLNAVDTPLEQIRLVVSGDFATVRVPATAAATPRLRVSLVWGGQWLPEPFCILPPESAAAAAVVNAGCPDSFRFAAACVDVGVAVQPGVPTAIGLFSVPSADLMVGDVTARVAYGSVVVYDDQNGNGVLDLRRTAGPGGAGTGARWIAAGARRTLAMTRWMRDRWCRRTATLYMARASSQ